MKTKLYSIFLLLIIILIYSCSSITTDKFSPELIEKLQQDMKKTKNNPEYKKDVVPNAWIAAKIAEAVLLPIYGDRIIAQKPFKCELLQDSIWYVKGDSHTILTEKSLSYIDFVGQVYIQKKDGKILRITSG